MNYPPYDPNNSEPYSGRSSSSNRPSIPQPTGLEKKFYDLPGWGRLGLIGLSGLVFISTIIFSVLMVGGAMGLSLQALTGPALTTVSSPVPTSTPLPLHYPPTTESDLRGLAAKGDASAIHEFHSESVGLTGVCPQPKREVTVDPSITGQTLAEDLLTYFYAQQLDGNACGSAVFAYYHQTEANDPNTGGTYTAGLINVDVTDSSGATNTDPNASNLKYKLTLDIGTLGSNQEYIVTY